MAENAPPTNSTSNGDSSRGMPYYDKLRRDLRETLQKKRNLDAQILSLDEKIFQIETDYLETTTAGNIIKGFDNYIKGTIAGSAIGAGGGTATRRKGGITDADRIFSRSSANFTRDSPGPSSSQAASSQAPTPHSNLPQSARESNHPTPTSGTTKIVLNPNRKKKAPDDDEADGRSNKRGKITYGRD